MTKTDRPLHELTTVWKFGVGDEVKDVMTGMQGIIAARIEWLDGCRRYLVQSGVVNKSTGEAGPERNSDEGLLVLIKPNKVVVADKMPPAPRYERVPGGPKEGDRAATRRASVSSASR